MGTGWAGDLSSFPVAFDFLFGWFWLLTSSLSLLYFSRYHTIATTRLPSNIGVYTNPEHDLWVAEAEPSLESVQKGGDLKVGEVLLNVKSTGICGSDIHFWHAVRSSYLYLKPRLEGI
jgi:hypothetical protein